MPLLAFITQLASQLGGFLGQALVQLLPPIGLSASSRPRC